MKSLRLTILYLILTFPLTGVHPMAGGEIFGEVEQTSDWGGPQPITIVSPNGPLTAEIRELTFVWRHSSTFVVNHKAALIYIPSSQMYWIGLSYGNVYFATNDAIGNAYTTSGPQLRYNLESRRLTQPFTDPTSQQLIKDALQTRFLRIATSAGFDAEDKLKLDRIFGSFAFEGQPDSRGEPAPSIENVTVSASTVTFTLKARTRALLASLVLDHSMQPIAAMINGKQVYPPLPPTPTLTAFTPASGSSRDAVTLTGTNFTGATAVRFGKRDADDFTVDGPTQITAYPPEVSSGTTTQGARGTRLNSGGPTAPFTDKINVVTPAGTAASAADFSVLAPPPVHPGGGG